MRNRFPVTVHILFKRDDKVLLLRRANTGYEDGNYSVVAGHIDGGETIIHAAIREIKEEAGVDVLPEELKVAGVMHRHEGDERIDFFLVIQNWQGILINAEPGKCDDLRWFPIDSLPENIIPYVRRGIELTRKANDTMWFDSFGWELP